MGDDLRAAIAAEVAATLEELDKLVLRGAEDTRQPGDVDADQLAEHWHCCTQTARDRMRKVVERGQFAAVKVWDAERKMTITVWRRV